MRRLPSARAAWTWLRGEPWRLTAAAVGLAATLVGLATGIADLADRLSRPPKVRDPNVEIVLDRSAAMARNWAAGTTKFAAAVRRVDEIVTGEERGHNLALRAFGGACGQDSDRLVGFGTDNAERIRDELADAEPQGESDLVVAVADATNDFGDLDRFPNSVSKRIIVLTAGHTCPGDAAAIIRERMLTIGQERRLALDFRFIGVGLSEEQRAALSDISRAVRAPEPIYPETEEQLQGALRRVAVVEPLVESIEAVRRLVDASVGELNAFARATFDDRDAAEARRQLSLAEQTVDRSRTRFDRVASRYGAGALAELYRLAAANMALQKRVLELARHSIDLADQKPGIAPQEREDAVGEWNTLVGEYNENNRAMDEITRKLAA